MRSGASDRDLGTGRVTGGTVIGVRDTAHISGLLVGWYLAVYVAGLGASEKELVS